MTFKLIYLKTALLFLLFIAGISGLADFTVNSISYKWDVMTEEHLDELLVNAGTAYGVSRGLNAVISVIQASDINIVIGNLALGEALDPVNDIVERFSNIVLLSITSLGIQKFIYSVGMKLGVNLFLTLAAFFLVMASAFESLPSLKGEKVIALGHTLGTSFLIIFLLIRFIIPSAAFFSRESAKIFDADIIGKIEKLEEIKTESQLEYNSVSRDMSGTEDETIEDEESLFSRFTNSVRNAGKNITDTFSTTRIRENINRVINSLQQSIDYITDLIVIFIIQTIVIPILTFFLLKASFQPLVALFFSSFKREIT